MFLLVFIPIIYLIINAVIASKFNDIAYMKGYGPEMHCFAMCFWLGILGCLYVIALPDRGARDVQNTTTITTNNSNPITNAEPDNSNTKFNNEDSPEFKNKKGLQGRKLSQQACIFAIKSIKKGKIPSF